MKPTYIVPYRRKREGRTNYHKRLALLKSGKNRLVVRRSTTRITAQVTSFGSKGDKILASADSGQLSKYGWKGPAKNSTAAYLTGMLAGKRAGAKGVKEVILDSGMITTTKGSRVYAALKGVKDAGLKVECSEEILPSEERIQGKHVMEYAAALQKGDPERYSRYFSAYLKAGVKPEDMAKQYEEVKEKIMQG